MSPKKRKIYQTIVFSKDEYFSLQARAAGLSFISRKMRKQIHKIAKRIKKESTVDKIISLNSKSDSRLLIAKEARAVHLLLNFIRGNKYLEVEATCRIKPSAKDVKSLLHAIFEQKNKRLIVEELFNQWIDGKFVNDFRKQSCKIEHANALLEIDDDINRIIVSPTFSVQSSN